MLDELEKTSGLSRDLLTSEFQAIHQRHGTSEYAFSIQELPSLIRKHPGEDLPKIYSGAIEAYRRGRRSAMRLYPTVAETLETLRDQRCLIVAYTESMAFYSNYRLRSLGLDRLIDYLYSPPDHSLPKGLSREQLRNYPEDHYRLRRTRSRYTPAGQLKPSREILERIIEEVGADRGNVVYVGDSIMKDIVMARDAGVRDVWAKYGTAQSRPEYELLRAVTHWSAADVERERQIAARSPLSPTWVLESEFAEILDCFEFTEFMAPARVSFAVEAWKTTVQVQQHFNDLELRIRNFAVTSVAAILGLVGYAAKESHSVAVLGIEVPLASLLLLLGLLVLGAFWFMDRHWYHRLLVGAVKHGQSIENRLQGQRLPEFALREQIGRESPVKFWRWTLPSKRKMDLFYGALGVTLLLGSLVTFLVFWDWSAPGPLPLDPVPRPY